MVPLPAVLAGLSTALVVVTFAGGSGHGLVDRLGWQVSEGRKPGARFRRVVRQLGEVGFLSNVASNERMARDLRFSAIGATAHEVAGWKVVAGLAGASLGLLMPFPGPLLAPLLAVIGFRIPDIALRRAAKRRAAAADAEVPQLLDLLAAGLSAGLAAPLALARSSEAVRGPLAAELGSSLRAIQLGRRWRDELAALSSKLGSPDLHRLVAMLARTESLGSPLAGSIRDLAEQVRRSRAVATAERARKAPVKMLFPLVFLILPAFLLLTVVPVLLSTLRSIH